MLARKVFTYNSVKFYEVCSRTYNNYAQVVRNSTYIFSPSEMTCVRTDTVPGRYLEYYRDTNIDNRRSFHISNACYSLRVFQDDWDDWYRAMCRMVLMNNRELNNFCVIQIKMLEISCFLR